MNRRGTHQGDLQKHTPETLTPSTVNAVHHSDGAGVSGQGRSRGKCGLDVDG
jgi:hypothetical protein